MWKFGGVIRLLHNEAKGFSRYIVTIIISLFPHIILPFLLEFGHRHTENDHLVKTKLASFATKLSFTLIHSRDWNACLFYISSAKSIHFQIISFCQRTNLIASYCVLSDTDIRMTLYCSTWHAYVLYLAHTIYLPLDLILPLETVNNKV